MNDPALSRALTDLSKYNSAIFLEDTNIRVVYRCRPSALPAVRNAIAVLRKHKFEAITLLTEKLRGATQAAEKFGNRDSVDLGIAHDLAPPPMPRRIKLVSWNPKQAPVAIDTCTVVVDVALFIKKTLEQLNTALTHDKRWVGWSVPQLTDRLRQAGVVVELGK